jgi:NAD(P)-dependent dehydrogenase (short-subunit alcohol dehydrogenase family)
MIAPWYDARAMSAQKPGDVPPIRDWSRLLDGQIAVVTGGGDGIGGAISSLFAQHGARVEIAEIDPARAERKAAEIRAAGGTARAHVVDVTRDADVARLAEAVLGAHGRVDVLVNNVGDYRPLVPFAKSGPDSWDAMYQINLRHFFAVTRAFVRSMIERGGGVIVNFHSVEGMRGYPSEPVYAAMKAAVAHFTTSLAVTLGRHGIRVNGIGTDLTQTPQVDYLTSYEDHDELWRSWAPVGRLGWPEDQARVALFLASPLSAYVTGHNVPVDGGTKAGGGWFFSPREGRFVNRPRNI